MAPGDPCPRCGGPTTGVVLAWKRPAEQRLACVGFGRGRSCGWSGAEPEAGMPKRGPEDDPRLTGIVSARIRRRRLAKGWTQWKLAEETGLALSTVHRIEMGSRLPSLPVLAVIARALGCRPAELVP